MRNISISVGEHYHVFNRGVNKQTIFVDDYDRKRFLFLILFFQSNLTFRNIGRLSRELPESVQHSVLHNEDVVRDRNVELVSFCLMPNHFHLILKETKEKGISSYMQRVLNAYTKYFNERYEKSGHLFQGPYKAVYISDDRQLLHLSAYIHKNPTELGGYEGEEDSYIWSSYLDFIKDNRFGGLLMPEVIMSRFKEKSEYQEYVKTSLAKSSELTE